MLERMWTKSQLDEIVRIERRDAFIEGLTYGAACGIILSTGLMLIGVGLIRWYSVN